jgi:hypothetical protein
MRVIIISVFSFVVFISIAYFFGYHLYLNLYDITELERKYKFRKLDSEVKKLGIVGKLKMTYQRLLLAVKGTNLFDLFWPD